MQLVPTPLAGAFTIDVEPRHDERGHFARVFCRQAFAAAGVDLDVAQANHSYSARRGTLRGLHYQLPPSAEIKLVRCLAGALWDVIVDLRPGSPTFARWFGAELTSRNQRMMLVPRGFAHGFITLADHTEMLYLVGHAHDPAAERGVRFDDPAIGIRWPIAPLVVSAKDRGWPLLDATYQTPSSQPSPPGEEALLPLPRAGEGWGRSGGFEPHAASPLSGSGLQAGTRTASEGLLARRAGPR